MGKDVAYYRNLLYEQEWFSRDDTSGQYVIVRLRDIPQIYGTGATRAKALAGLRTAFDDHIQWCLDEGVDIPEPSMGA